jgi:hypothetical protein
MITIPLLTKLFGWASVINITYLILATLSITFMKGTMSALHSKMFGIDEKALDSKYFDFLSMYKIATLVFTISPYIALKIIG